MFVQAVFFTVSMLLTGLFSLSLSGVDIGQLTENEWEGQSVFLTVLFVLIGCCIDIGKYLFWLQRKVSRYFQALSITLMVFSWLASCAFFLSSEMQLLKNAQYRSPEYAAIEEEISNLQRSINIAEQLLNKRLGSSYHKQWEQAQQNADTITKLQKEIVNKQQQLSEAGLMAATSELGTTRFFIAISRTLNISLDSARTFGYSILALLLEASTLGMISLASAEKQKNNSLGQHSHEPELNLEEGGLIDEESRQKLTQLTVDILNGRIRPVLRTIKSAGYGLSLDQIRAVLHDLHATGILDTDIRNSYKLSEKVSR